MLSYLNWKASVQSYSGIYKFPQEQSLRPTTLNQLWHDSEGKRNCLQCRRPWFNPWAENTPLEKGVATHSGVLAWRMPWSEEPGELQSMGSQRVRHNSPNQMCCLVLLSHSVLADSLQPHGLQHASLPCPSPPPRVCSNSCPFSWWCHPIIPSSVSPLFLPSIFPSIRVFPSELALCIRWPKNWSFSLNISSSNEYSGLISFRIDWFDLLAVYGTLKSLIQHHSLKASVLQCSVFFMVQLSYPYMNTRNIVVLTTQTFISRVISLLFNMLSRLVIAFLPRIRHLLISWLQSYTVYFPPILFIFMSLSTLLLLPGVFMTPVFHIWGLPIPQSLACSIMSSLVSCFSGSQISLAPNTLSCVHTASRRKSWKTWTQPCI